MVVDRVVTSHVGRKSNMTAVTVHNNGVQLPAHSGGRGRGQRAAPDTQNEGPLGHVAGGRAGSARGVALVPQ